MAGRPESPVDPDDGPVQRLAYGLRKLREEAGGLTYREMARLTRYGASTLSNAAAGERLPSLPVLQAYVRVCGGAAQEWERRWHQAAREEAALPPSDEDADPPYRGLGRFEPGDRDLFFGRDELVAKLAAHVGAHPLVAVVGTSGSGKSSLLRAGLIPVLRDPGGPGPLPAAIRILTPGAHPLAVHAALLAPAEGHGDTVVVIDQFEELFTLCADPVERAAFLDLLLTSVSPGGGLRAVIAVRADFFARCAEHHRLAEALREATLVVGPMGPAELREAIVKPAAAVGLIVERELTARIISEVADESGGLPLMSHALLETWRRRKGRALTMAAYDAAGGVHGALSHTAEQFYARLNPEQAATARRILLRLVAPGQGVPDTGQPATRAELVIDLLAGERTRSSVVIERLALARLITLDGDTVTPAHEALLTAWPRLRSWINDARDRLRLHRRLTLDARTWQELDRDPGALYRGTRLASAQEVFAEHRGDLTGLERSFLDASADTRRQERRGATRAARRLRVLLGSLSFLVVLSLLAGAAAWRERSQGASERLLDAAHTAVALAGSLRDSDPQEAMRLSLAAYRMADTDETRSALMSAMAQPEQDDFPVPADEGATRPFLVDHGRDVLSVGARKSREWDVRDQREHDTATGSGPSAAVAPDVLAVSDDGTTIATQADDGALRLWNAVTRKPLGGPFGSAAGTPAFSADGHTVAVMGTGASGTTVQLWGVIRQRLVFSRPADSVYNRPVAVSDDDRYLAWCQDDGRLQLWNAVSGHRVALAHDDGTLCRRTVSAASPGPSPRFSPDGRSLAVIDDNGDVRRWDVTGEELSPLKAAPVRRNGTNPATDDGKAVVYSTDGSFLAVVDADGVTLWHLGRPVSQVWYYAFDAGTVVQPALDIADHAFRYLVPDAPDHPPGPGTWSVRTLDLGPAVTAARTPHAAAAVALSAEGTASAVLPAGSTTARLEVESPRTHARTAESVPGVSLLPTAGDGGATAPPMSFSTDGTTFAYAVSSDGKSPPDAVRVWNTVERRATATFAPASPGEIAAFALNSDGTQLVVLTTGTHHGISLWNVPDHRILHEYPRQDIPPLAFRPDARLLVASVPARRRADATVVDQSDLIDTPSDVTVPAALGKGVNQSMAFSPDSHYLAVGDAAGGVTLWSGEARPLSVLPSTVVPDSAAAGTPTLAFSPRGNLLAVADRNGTLQVWDTSTGEQVGSDLPNAGDDIQALAFSPDGGTLYAQGTHTPLQSYRLSPDRVTAQVCARVGGEGLSPAQWHAYITAVPYRATC